MRRLHCPKCGSTNVNSLVFYRPSAWKCLDCGYDGPLVIEDSESSERQQTHPQETDNISGIAKTKPSKMFAKG